MPWFPNIFSSSGDSSNYIVSDDNTTPVTYDKTVKTWNSVEHSEFNFTKLGNNSAYVKIYRGLPCVEMALTSNYNSFIGPSIKPFNVLIFVAFDDRQTNTINNNSPLLLMV